MSKITMKARLESKVHVFKSKAVNHYVSNQLDYNKNLRVRKVLTETTVVQERKILYSLHITMGLILKYALCVVTLFTVSYLRFSFASDKYSNGSTNVVPWYPIPKFQKYATSMSRFQWIIPLTLLKITIQWRPNFYSYYFKKYGNLH